MKMRLRPWPEGFAARPTLTLCVNVRAEEFMPSCGRRGSLEIRERLEAALRTRGIEVDFQTIKCLGLCNKGPNARLAPSNSWFTAIGLSDVPALVDVVESELAKIKGGMPNGTHASSG
ncbi:MAG TPA: (2Fe-2S) ferredoxin domain-containing protein [Burkholderiales bacterium]|nr:(2Fe-2S) ferredoxin domain-containing protein [Burkholderiales bacterium]